MNNLRIIFYGFIVGTVVCVSDLPLKGGETLSNSPVGGKAATTMDELKKLIVEDMQRTRVREKRNVVVHGIRTVSVAMFPKSGCTVAATIFSSEMDQEQDFLNAAIDSLGLTADSYRNYYNCGKLHPSVNAGFDGMINLIVNYPTRKVSKYLNKNGFSVENMVSNPTLGVVAETVTQPQMVTMLIVWVGGKLLGLN